MPSRDEGFGLVFLEAMRAGKACIGGTGAAAEIIEHGVTGFVVDPARHGDVEVAVQLLYDDPGMCARYGGGARERFIGDVHRPAFPDTLRADPGATRPCDALAVDAAGATMNVLGLNAYHGDVSAALVRDGQLVAAVEEERFRRIKHVTGFPARAIDACLQMGGIGANEVDLSPSRAGPARICGERRCSSLQNRPKRTVADRARNMVEHRRAAGHDRRAARPRRVRRQAADAVRRASSGAPGERRVRQPVRRRGRVRDRRLRRFRQHVVGRVAGTRLDGRRRVFFPHSLGLLYLAVTQYLGFPNYGDEFKVMGLAPYGEPRYRARDRVARASAATTAASSSISRTSATGPTAWR